MSNMDGNPYRHFEEATALLFENPGQYELERSKVLATLALAYEQRTANLIAYITGSYPNGQGIYAGGDAHSQVIARLGMRESEGPF